VDAVLGFTFCELGAALEIRGVEQMSVGEVQRLVRQGGRFVIFTYTISVLVMTFRRPTAVYFIRPGESAAAKSLPYTVLSLFLGWWGIPWGFIYTPWSIIENLSGGKNVTNEMMASLGAGGAPQPLPSFEPPRPQ
jgi:hypothetical protein